MTGRTASTVTARRLPAAQDGNAAIEFGLIAPVFLILLLGFFDLGHMAYVKSELNGAVEMAARSSSLESGDTTVADNMVKSVIRHVVPNGTVTTSRQSYYDFADINRKEKWTDTNNNGTCDNGENYIDENRTGAWESNVGKSGNGGAGDVVLYTVSVTYKPIFSMKWFTTYNTNRTLTAVGVRKNQPFADQSSYGSSAGSCS